MANELFGSFAGLSPTPSHEKLTIVFLDVSFSVLGVLRDMKSTASEM